MPVKGDEGKQTKNRSYVRKKFNIPLSISCYKKRKRETNQNNGLIVVVPHENNNCTNQNIYKQIKIFSKPA